MTTPRSLVAFLACAVLALVIAACGGGGGSASAVCANCGGHSPAPSPSPTGSPVTCTIRRAPAQTQARFAFVQPIRPTVTSLVPGPGPVVQVCPDRGAGMAHCLSWIRTHVTVPHPDAVVPGYQPSDLQSAYGLTTASATGGVGTMVALVDAYDDPSAEADLATYRTKFGLPPCTSASGCFQKVNEHGKTSPLPGTDGTGGWEAEESLDLDMVSAICPNCDILLVETNSTLTSDLYTGEDTAVSTCGSAIVSDSWGLGEYSGETTDESHFHHPGVMITVAAGDNGYGDPTSGYPSSSQYVTDVGGTSLHHVSGVWSETVWKNSQGGTYSGCSKYISQPAWQTALGSAYTSVCSKRIENDVAAVADPNTGVAVYDSFGGSNGCPGWCAFGGTSASAPIIAGVYAIAGNGASLTYGSYSYTHAGSLNDVTSGSDGSCGGTYLCTAGVGYDGPTGNGTPQGTGAF